jgi:hypothetical protein
VRVDRGHRALTIALVIQDVKNFPYGKPGCGGPDKALSSVGRHPDRCWVRGTFGSLAPTFEDGDTTHHASLDDG